MAIEGELVVRVETRDGRVRRAQARSERPRLAGRLFAGRNAREAGALAGALFAICGRSQAIAADAAVEAARGTGESAGLRASRDARIAAETIQEHAWRLLVDWPVIAGRAPQVEALARGWRALAPWLAAAEGAGPDRARGETVARATDAVFGCAPATFLAIDSVDGFGGWTRTAGTPASGLAAQVLAEHAALGATDVAFLPAGGDAWVSRDLASAIDADGGFDDVPNWQGEARETGAVARSAGHPLVQAVIAKWGRGVGARFVSRLVEMAEALRASGGRHGAARLAAGSAVSWVDTARGLLVHRVVLEGDRIAAYRIVAPTEWNFHPAGAFTRAAMALDADDAARLEREVRWLVASLDPCVGVRYEAGHA